jgi:hypothetical protein
MRDSSGHAPDQIGARKDGLAAAPRVCSLDHACSPSKADSDCSCQGDMIGLEGREEETADSLGDAKLLLQPSSPVCVIETETSANTHFRPNKRVKLAPTLTTMGSQPAESQQDGAGTRSDACCSYQTGSNSQDIRTSHAATAHAKRSEVPASCVGACGAEEACHNTFSHLCEDLGSHSAGVLEASYRRKVVDCDMEDSDASLVTVQAPKMRCEEHVSHAAAVCMLGDTKQDWQDAVSEDAGGIEELS